MNISPYDIVIHVHLCDGGSIQSKDLLQALDTLESSLYASDRHDIEKAALRLNIPAVIRDACLERLRKHRNDRLLLTDAKSGSIEIIGIVAGVSYFVLQRTIGESFEEGFKKTELHASLREFFRHIIDEKALFISENLRRTFASRKKEAEVKSLPSRNDEPNKIIIDIHGKPINREDRVQSLGNELDESKRK